MIRVSLFYEALYMFVVRGESLRLNIRAEVSAFAGALVEFNTCPMQSLDEVFNSSLDFARLVRIFDPKNEFSVVVFCEKVIVECSAEPADMQETCGTGSETDADGSGHDDQS